MGRDLARSSFTRRERQQYRGKVHRCLNVLSTMLREDAFSADHEATTGVELELNLVDQHLDPSMRNGAVLDGVDSPELQAELGRWNVELNLPPRSLRGTQGRELEAHLLDLLTAIEKQAGTVGSRVMCIGILPTLTENQLVTELLSPANRYAALNEQMLAARGEPFRLDIEGTDGTGGLDGIRGIRGISGAGEVPHRDRPRDEDSVAPGGPVERLRMDFDSIAPEAACTSMQLHLQVPPQSFAAHWNAAQCLAGVQLAMGANSPYLLGRRLWSETRIPLFLQATDVRSVELRNQGVRPRVWFGERWIDSIFELFEENVRYFPGLLPVAGDEDPGVELAAGRTPSLEELRLHNGTIWRWNRPIYDVADGVPHLRVENRVLPAGPSVVDMVANAMFFYGLLRVLTDPERAPLWSSMPFAAAEQNFELAARDGMNARLFWPELGWVAPDQLVLRELLPMAADGLARWGVDDEISRRYLEVIEQRCLHRCTGSSWQVGAVEALQRGGADRHRAIRGMLERYLDGMAHNAPVHTWPMPSR